MRSGRTVLLLLSVACLCLGAVAECGPRRVLLSTETLDLSAFTEFEHINDFADDGEPYRIQIQHTSDGRYTFHAWKRVGPYNEHNTTELPIRDLSTVEVNLVKDTFSNVVIETYNRRGSRTDAVFLITYRWDDLTADQWGEVEMLDSETVTAIRTSFDTLLAGG